MVITVFRWIWCILGIFLLSLVVALSSPVEMDDNGGTEAVNTISLHNAIILLQTVYSPHSSITLIDCIRERKTQTRSVQATRGQVNVAQVAGAQAARVLVKANHVIRRRRNVLLSNHARSIQIVVAVYVTRRNVKVKS